MRRNPEEKGNPELNPEFVLNLSVARSWPGPGRRMQEDLELTLMLTFTPKVRLPSPSIHLPPCLWTVGASWYPERICRENMRVRENPLSRPPEGFRTWDLFTVG